jgi:hypothetical protein
MKRIFWVAAGAAAGILIARKLTKAARSLTPEGAAERVSDKVGGITGAFREFADDVRAGMAQRDNELRHALGIVDNGLEHADDARIHELFDDSPRGT